MRDTYHVSRFLEAQLLLKPALTEKLVLPVLFFTFNTIEWRVLGVEA